MSTTEINYRGITLEVTGRRIPEDEDGSPAYAEIDSVCVYGDIGELLSKEQWAEIEKRVLEVANEPNY